jgi:ATP-dependent Clp protease, protease subunit
VIRTGRSGSYPPPPPWRPGEPGRPGPGVPGHPVPGVPSEPSPAPQRPNPAIQPTRVWLDPVQFPTLHDRLLAQRIVIAHGWLDGDAATRLSAQLLTLDAEGTGPIRLELQSLDADLPAALSVMGVLDVLRAPVSAHVSGRVSGPALGVLAAARHRLAYPNAILVLSEPKASFDGTVTALAAQEEQARAMLGELFTRLAEVTGHDIGEIRADARRNRLFTVADAIAYGLIEAGAQPRRPAADRP